MREDNIITAEDIDIMWDSVFMKDTDFTDTNKAIENTPKFVCGGGYSAC